MAEPALDLCALPAELQDALARAWPGCPEAQRRAVLAPWCYSHWYRVWPDMLWPWQPGRRCWRPAQARYWRADLEACFASRRRNILEAKGPRLFEPDQPFFDTPWTHAEVLVRSPVPEVFSDGEVWAMAMQLFDGEIDTAADYAQTCARHLIANKLTRRARRSAWWQEELTLMRASATGSLGSL